MFNFLEEESNWVPRIVSQDQYLSLFKTKQ